MEIGSEVILIIPGNPRLDGASAVVSQIADWGAHVLTEAAATGKFRALFGEMILLSEANGGQHAHASGDLCSVCGGMMIRTGTCLTCSSCGESSGGCS